MLNTCQKLGALEKIFLRNSKGYFSGQYHILMDRLNDILLKAFEQDFEAEEGIILGRGGSYLVHLKTGPFPDHLTVIIKK